MDKIINIYWGVFMKWLFGAALVAGTTSCVDHLDALTSGFSEGKQVQISMPIGIADELSGTNPKEAATTKSGNSAFDVQPQIVVSTRANTSSPNILYNLEICQYDANGNFKKYASIASMNSGDRFTFSLDELDHCQLVFLVRGKSNYMPYIRNYSLQDVQKKSMAASKIIDATSLDDMPYILHLKDVNISDGKIKSPEGKDVRILLKRLAAELTLTWTLDKQLTDKGYSLTEVRLMQVPANYFALPERETIAPYGVMYPISTSEFVDGFRLKGTALAAATTQNVGTKTLWIPANARGTRSDVTNPYYRDKDRAHSAATYVEFVVDKTNVRLLYRAYLGENETNDFNLLENTNYVWSITLKSDNYIGDSRIQLLDQTPVTSTNELTTSNCFMMQPGTNFCFNPYLHEAAPNGQNTYLSDKTIDKVEVLWQSKDAGTSGDLVMGYAGKDSQKNLVNYTDISDRTKARVHVKFPYTNGGNAVIAAYANDVIVWSWHLWVSDYVPTRINGTAITNSSTQMAELQKARAASKGGTVHQYAGAAWTYNSGNYYNKVIMDRNLGAKVNTWSTDNAITSAMAFGNLYQWGRKDPFPGSADGSEKEIKLMFDKDGVEVQLKKSKGVNADQRIQNPGTFYTEFLDKISWGQNKTIYDPCPAGWRIPYFDDSAVTNLWSDLEKWKSGLNINDFEMLVKGSWLTSNISSFNESHFHVMNGMRYKTVSGDYVWFPFYRLRESGSGNLRIPYIGSTFYAKLCPTFNVSSAKIGTNNASWTFELWYGPSAPAGGSGTTPYAFGARCVQDNKDGK